MNLNIENLWRFAKFTPNEEQKAAIQHTDGPLYLTAGPGSGKTRVLLWRTVNLMVFHGVKPEEIYLSTFTEKAALQLKQGLQSLLGIVTNINGQPYDLSQMYIGTVHSLCQRILADRRHFAVDRQRSRPPQLLDDLGQYFHLSRNRNWRGILEKAGLEVEGGNASINDIFGYPSQSKHVAVNNCRAVFNRFSEECIDPAEALQKLENGDPAMLQHFAGNGLSASQVALLIRLYAAYRESLQLDTVRLTDFALIQQEAFRVLEQVEGAGRVFKHVIVDEYQDTNTIQERIFFRLGSGNKNICVVGDDDQALYRFRGATVENFVEFPARCQRYLQTAPRRISLDTNYRSRDHIVDFYKQFIKQADWAKPNGQGHYRVVDKDIRAHRVDMLPAVVASTPAAPETACAEIAELVKRLIDEGKVENPNQVAFLYPSLKYNGAMTDQVRRMKEALEAVGLKVYAPRAGRFLEVEESFDIFGLLFKIIGRPSGFEFRSRDYDSFQEWADLAEQTADALMAHDPRLKQYVTDRRKELEQARADYECFLKVVERNRWQLNDNYDSQSMGRALAAAPGLSEQARRQISGQHFNKLVAERQRKGEPLSLLYALKRATSIDWNVLDLFYRLCGFEHFKKMFDAAERNGDEGATANLGLITQYLARFVEEKIALITADLLVEKVYQTVFFAYLFALYRLGETELEDADDPFPKGRIPFLTIHQSKGLEFPVVVLGNPRKDDRGPNKMEVIARPLMGREPGEPLDRMSEFDIMRMFYVALSRAKNLLVIANFTGRGQRMSRPFPALLDANFPRIPALNVNSIPAAGFKEETLPKAYSFTSDYLQYQKCPRQYMIFRKFGFVPSRSQTMFFGQLVHRTLEDLHHELIRRRGGSLNVEGSRLNGGDNA
jgi:DNA helicase-2/ATP-dependent DNA helicase PcrA